MSKIIILFLASYKHVLSVRIAAAPSFPGLRQFPEGRGFKQWTGDDSKALMKVGIFGALLLGSLSS